MKRLLLLMGIIAMAHATNATNYYVSATGNDALAGTSPTTAWKTLSKVNAFAFAANDSILLKRGDVFLGSIIPNRNNLNFSAYGTGSRPLITGFTTLSAWSLVSTGIYKASVNAKSNLNMVTINGRPQQIGRYPNADATNGGYLTFESSASSSSITDNEMTSALNWSGAEIAVRKNGWVIDRAIITAHSGTTFNFRIGWNTNSGATPLLSAAKVGHGYFIMDDIRTLDQMGEWYYDTTGKSLNVYFGSNVPSNYSVKVSVVDTLMNLASRTYISVNEIDFEGGNISGIYSFYGGNITIRNCKFTNIGSRAVHIFNSNDAMVDNVQVFNCLSNSIQVTCRSKNNITVKNCLVQNNGPFAGMGSFFDDADYKGIYALVSTTGLIENNVVDTVGLSGIQFNGNDVVVQKNYVNYFCYRIHDNGGIYTYASGTSAAPGPTYTNRIVRNNIIRNGIGAPDGTSSPLAYLAGIYLDGRTMNVIVQGNTVFNSAKNGVHCNNPSVVTIRDNTFFNNLNDVSFMRWAWGGINNLNIKNNIIFSLNNTQRNIYYTNGGLNSPVATTLQANLMGLGVIDSNYYNSFSDAGIQFEVYETTGGAMLPTSPMSLDGWKSLTSHDVNGNRSKPKVQPYTITNTVSANLFANSQFNTNISGVTLYGAGTTAAWDNTGKITGTGSIRLNFSSPTPNRFSFIHSPVGAISNSKKYVIKFKTLGTTVNGIVRAYIRKTGSPYNALVATQSRSFGTTKTSHEFLFDAPTTDAAGGSYVIEIDQNSGTTYIDDIEFYEVNATINTIASQVRLEYNATNAAKTIMLDGRYASPDSTIYNGSVTLQPFSSKVLVKLGVINLPICNAGLDKYVFFPADTVSLAGTGTGSTITAYLWTKIAGPTQFTINHPTSPAAKITNLVIGTYKFELMVTDNLGNIARDTLSVVVSSVLPVRLLQFSGSKNKNKVDLKWVTESEVNSSNYVVERSIDGRIFNNIGQVASANIISRHSYNFTDNTPLKGTNYYRLKMVDNDNAIKYSNVVKVSMGNNQPFTVENAAVTVSGIKLTVNAAKNQLVNIVAVDAAGRVMMKKQVQLQVGSNTIASDVPAVPKGIFYINLFTDESNVVRTVLSE